MVVKVLINTSVRKLNKVFDYFVPKELENDIKIGKRVSINFGVGVEKANEGIIVKILTDEEFNLQQSKVEKKYKLKEIIDILDEYSYVDEQKLKFAKWISQNYFCNVYDALKLMVPPGTSSINSSKKLKEEYYTVVNLNKNIEDIEEDILTNKIGRAHV